jgi:general nucleoside transport system permease protein
MSPLLKNILSPEFVYAIFRVTTPILYAAMGVAISELAGAQNIALEGIMLISAFTGVVVSAVTGSLLLALVAGICAGVLLALILGYFHLGLKADITLSAIALNMLASGITVFLLFLITGDKGSSNSLKSLTFPEIALPVIGSIPVLGRMISGHNVLTYVAFLLVPVFYVVVYRTPLGLRIRAVGQNKNAAESVGINANRIKLTSLIISGVFGALGGLYLSMGYVSWFSRDMTAGRGFIAIAASTLGGLAPLGVLLSSLLFGLVNAFAVYIAAIKIPSELIQMIPYVMTVVALIVFAIQKQAARTREAPKEVRK